jgi:integrase
MHQRKRLTDRLLQSLKPAPTGKRYDVMDADVRGFGVRVTDKGQRSFIFVARYPGSANPTRRALGEYPTLSLIKARAKAKRWHELVSDSVDPKDEEERKRREAERKKADSFDAVLETYNKRVLSQQRRGHIVEKELRKFFGEEADWKGKPITSIERQDVIDAITDKPLYQAHNLFGSLRSMFNWAIESGGYGLEHSPCDRIRPKRLLGERKPRQRVLTDTELKAFWKATGKMLYPWGPLYRLLLLTGCRKSEIADAQRGELAIAGDLLTIPSERFKSDASHLVPLTDSAMVIVKDLPTFTKGEYLFSTTFGKQPVGGFAGAKERLDKLMTEELGEELKPFRIHDLRRTVRTRLASLKVPDKIAEMVIGHGKKGLGRVYDQHTYLDEMRDAVELWASKLRDIVEPPPANIVKLKKARP